MCVTEVELAWAAGFFDGEGNTYVRVPTGRDYGYVVVSVGQCDPRPLERFQEAVNAGHVYGPYDHKGKNNSPVWRWQANGWEARRVLAQLSWFLSRPKYEQAVEASQKARYGRITQCA